MRRRLDAFVDRERAFTRNVSHELRTPIAVIMGALAVLRRRQQAGECEVPEALVARMAQAGEDLTATVETCLWLAREDAAPLRQARAGTGALVATLVERHRPLLGDRPVTVHVDGEDLVHENFPGEAFRLVAGNLIRNAMTYTRRGRIQIRVALDGLTVLDTGPGLPEGALPAAGEPWRPSPAAHGQGIGLSVVRRVCSRCGWDLQVTSGSSGTEFQVRFNAARG